MINNDINSLEEKFKGKLIDFLEEAKEKGFDIMVFEGLRTKERQKELYAQGRTSPGKIVTWTMESNHLTGQAVDIVFKDKNGNPSWIGDYDALIEIAKKYGIRNLRPKETCHFEDDGTIYLPKEKSMSKYTNIMKKTLEETKFSPIFITHDGDKPITEGEVKELIEIAFARVSQRKI